MNSEAVVVKSAERVLDVLEMLSLEQDRGLRLTDIADRLSIPKSSATMLMKTLDARCYAARGQDGRYRLHPLFQHASGWVGGLHARLLHVARPVMAALVERTGETCFLGTLSADLQVRVLHKVVSPKEVRYDTDDRPLRPAYCTSIGRVQLAFLPQEWIEDYLTSTRLERFTENTLTTPEALRADLAAIRDCGFAESIDTREIGASGVSAPIFGRDGEVIAGLNLSAVTQRFLSQHEAMRAAVMAAADDISAHYGAPNAERLKAAKSEMAPAAALGPV
ncbi:MAG TPA: IclR family transcriptional regulator [Azospirillum sp.]|nr:IclR family transcriptional regulator [Azospirillum sp.]